MTDDKKEPRTAKPESLEAKFKLLALLPYDRRAKRKHSLVFGFILDWYHSKYGDAMASVRHVTSTIKERDPASSGLYAGDVHAALTDLVSWGYLEQELGTGRRASRYVPVWAKLDSVHKTPNATEDGISVRENANTCVRENANTTSDSVRDSTNEDPSTVTRLQDRVNGEMDNECAAPTAPPPASPFGAAGAGTAQDGFDELWRAYAHKKQKKEARAAYAKLAPSAELHAEIVAGAILWRESWAAQNKPDAPRYTLAKWLEREDYECTPPTAFRPKERKMKGSPAADNQNARAKLPGNKLHTMRIVEIKEVGSPFEDYRINLRLVGVEGDMDGQTIEHQLHILSKAGPESGQRPFNALCDAVQDNGPLKDVVGKLVAVTNLPDGGLGFGRAVSADEADDFNFGEAA